MIEEKFVRGELAKAANITAEQPLEEALGVYRGANKAVTLAIKTAFENAGPRAALIFENRYWSDMKSAELALDQDYDENGISKG